MLMFPMVLAVGLLWGGCGWWVWSGLYGPELASQTRWQIQRLVGLGSAVGALVGLGWLGHVARWGDCMRANGCEVLFFGGGVLLFVSIPAVAWVVGCMVAIVFPRATSEVGVSVTGIHHADMTLTMRTNAAWPVVTVAALWVLLPPLGPLAALWAFWARPARLAVDISGSEVRLRQGTWERRLPLRGLRVDRRVRWDGALELSLASADLEEVRIMLGGTPVDDVDTLAGRLRALADGASVEPGIPAAPRALRQLMLGRDVGAR